MHGIGLIIGGAYKRQWREKLTCTFLGSEPRVYTLKLLKSDQGWEGEREWRELFI